MPCAPTRVCDYCGGDYLHGGPRYCSSTCASLGAESDKDWKATAILLRRALRPSVFPAWMLQSAAATLYGTPTVEQEADLERWAYLPDREVVTRTQRLWRLSARCLCRAIATTQRAWRERKDDHGYLWRLAGDGNLDRLATLIRGSRA